MEFRHIEIPQKLGNLLLSRKATGSKSVGRREIELQIFGAGDGDRTRDVQLGKLAFYR